jgi:carboxyl-terminal processing protease
VPVIETQEVKDTFIIALYSFSETSAQKFQEALQKFSESKKKNLIIDLRNNPGGYLEASVLMASFFFPSDKLIVSEDFARTGQKNTHFSKGFNSIPSDVKMVILVNKGSASASEIFAGAFQDYNRAKIVGEQSFGKGSVQEYMDLPNGTSLKVTVAKWLTPLGNSISDHGITPDILVAYKENKAQIVAKIKNLSLKIIDNQLAFALKVLENWSKYENHKALDKTQFELDKKAATTTATTSAIYKRFK